MNLPPSEFARMGQPNCSRWGKGELEWLALAYVQALAADGDTWKPLTRERVYELLNDEQRRFVHSMLTSDFEVYVSWFDAVSRQLKDSDGAWDVRGFWNLDRYHQATCHE
jgi:hypothetical protein